LSPLESRNKVSQVVADEVSTILRELKVAELGKIHHFLLGSKGTNKRKEDLIWAIVSAPT
jgi:hypothetical protein